MGEFAEGRNTIIAMKGLDLSKGGQREERGPSDAPVPRFVDLV